MLNDILFAVWFFLPAGVANTAPIIAAKMPLLDKWDTPIDFHKSHNGKRLLGQNKTWRGIVAGVFMGTLVFLLQRELGSGIDSFDAYLQELNYFDEPLILGTLLGLGALTGDAVKSFVKRKLNIASGSSWFPFDQLDYIIGGCLFALPVIVLPLQIYFWVLFVWFFMHLLFSYIGFRLHLKSTPI